MHAALLVFEVLHEIRLVIYSLLQSLDLLKHPEVTPLLFRQVQLILDLALLTTFLVLFLHLSKFLVEEVAFPEGTHFFAVERGHQIAQLVLLGGRRLLFQRAFGSLRRVGGPVGGLATGAQPLQLFAEGVPLVAPEAHEVLEALELGPPREDKVTHDLPEVADLALVEEVEVVVEAEVGEGLQDVGRGPVRLHHELAHQLVVVFQVQEVEQLPVEAPARHQLAQHPIIVIKRRSVLRSRSFIHFFAFFLEQLFFPQLNILLLRTF